MKKLLFIFSLLFFFLITPLPITAILDNPCGTKCPTRQKCSVIDNGPPIIWGCLQDPSYLDPTCNNNTGIRTALGCFPINPQSFIVLFFRWVLPLAGLSAFLLIVFAAFTHITSAGNPEKQQKAKEMISSAITGLLLIIFSIVILKIIGDIFQLPGLTQ